MVNLISLSSPLGGGKDEVAKIIQYLTSNDVNEVKNYNEWRSYRLGLNSKGYKDNWENKKFAQKLKQIAALLIGCRVEDLENQKFKKSYLSDEWLDVNYGTNSYSEDFKNKSTIREFLQYLGTNVIRNVIHPNTWVNALFTDYVSPEVCACKEFNKTGNGAMMCFMCQEVIGSKWIISDTRFLNEIEAIKNKGGICIKIDNNRITDTGNHSSENEWKEYNDWDYTINNSGSIKDLVKEVKTMLQHFKIIK